MRCKMKIGFIGTGNMGGALAVAAAKKAENTVLLANRHPEKAKALAEKIAASVSTNEEIVSSCDFIFLGVKPQVLPGLASDISEKIKARTSRFIIVSMAAGTAISKVQSLLGVSCPVIRIMPNTPVSVGEGMILYACSKEVAKEEELAFLDAMSEAGRFSKLDENLIDAGSAVSGCGPAFAAMFIEALADGGVACGLPRAKAMEFASQMVYGTAKMIMESGNHPGIVKDAVCSPGGTTIQGVRTLEQNAFRGAVTDAVISAYEKTLKL